MKQLKKEEYVKFEIEFLKLAGTFFICRWVLMGNVTDGPQHKIGCQIGELDYWVEMQLLCKEVKWKYFGARS